MNLKEFENRKKDHLDLSMKVENQASGLSGFDPLSLEHDALCELNFDQIDISTNTFQKLKTPFYISSMTAGHKDAVQLNILMAQACETQGWMMGVGSQRRELSSKNTLSEWKELRKKAPNAVMLGNLGISQLIQCQVSDVQKLVDSIEAKAMFIHLNVLQECLQPEGTPQFQGALKAIERLANKLSVPVVVKETGCGFSLKSMKSLKNKGIAAVDVSGLGGTHWGRIEGMRAEEDSLRSVAAKTFQDWGVSTVQSLLNGIKIKPDYQLWASGGIRSGLDAAKSVALGADHVGYAKPALENALIGREALFKWMKQIEFELKIALMCTGCKNLKALKKTAVHEVLI